MNGKLFDVEARDNAVQRHDLHARSAVVARNDGGMMKNPIAESCLRQWPWSICCWSNDFKVGDRHMAKSLRASARKDAGFRHAARSARYRAMGLIGSGTRRTLYQAEWSVAMAQPEAG